MSEEFVLYNSKNDKRTNDEKPLLYKVINKVTITIKNDENKVDSKDSVIAYMDFVSKLSENDREKYNKMCGIQK